MILLVVVVWCWWSGKTMILLVVVVWWGRITRKRSTMVGGGRGSTEYHSPGNCYGLELYPLDSLGEGVIKDGAPHGDW